MKAALKKLAFAASFLTSIPFLCRPETEEDFAGLARYLPAVGILIGLLLFVFYFLISSLSSNEYLRALLLLLAWIVLTGAIHLDGFMDSADGLLSHRSRERMLEIMRDSRVGNYGAICGLMLILAKLIGLAALEPWQAAPVLILIPAFARFAEAVAIVSYPYARESGMGKLWHQGSKKSDLIAAALAPLALAFLLAYFSKSMLAFWLVPLTLGPGLVFAFLVQRILKGQTGDTYGACVEFSEASALIILSLIQDSINL